MITLKKGTSILICCLYHVPRSIESEYNIEFNEDEIYTTDHGYGYYYHEPFPLYNGDKVYRISWK